VSWTFATQSRSASFIASFKRLARRLDRLDLCAEQLHAEHVGLLPRDVLGAHEDRAGQAEQRRDGRGGDAMLARAGLGDDPRLAHAASEQDLADAIVDLVRAGVVQLFALQIDLRAAQFRGQPFGEIEWARAADILAEQIFELVLEGGIGLAARYSRSRSRISGISVSAT
jgi:hypothetical protein